LKSRYATARSTLTELKLGIESRSRPLRSPNRSESKQETIYLGSAALPTSAERAIQLGMERNGTPPPFLFQTRNLSAHRWWKTGISENG